MPRRERADDVPEGKKARVDVERLFESLTDVLRLLLTLASRQVDNGE